MNTCTFTGRIVADAEMRSTTGGTELCKFRLASDTGWGDRKTTHWLDCVIFVERGRAVQPHLRKGDPVTVVGDLQVPRIYQAKDGEYRSAQDVIVRELAMQGKKQDGGEGTQEGAQGRGGAAGYPGQGQGSRAPSAPSQGASAAPDPFDDSLDIPF
jgi:single-strand DNA-binding protein